MRTIRHRDGTVQHVYAGPNARRPHRRRPHLSATGWFIVISLTLVILANHGVL